MKTLARFALFYTILGLSAGLFYREFTKMYQIENSSGLGLLHGHLLALGTLFFLIVLILEKQFNLSAAKSYGAFLWTYNSGLLVTVFMLMVRGITKDLQLTLSKGLDASIAGIAGLGHIALSVGLIMLLLIVQKRAAKNA